MNNSIVNQYVSNNNDKEEQKKKNRKRAIILIIIMLLLAPVAYYRVKVYIKTTKVVEEVKLIYNVMENKQSYYDEESGAYYSYFVLYNYKENQLSPFDLAYDIVVKNKNESNGIFKIEDVETGEITDYSEEVRINGIIPHANKKEKKFKIYISSTNTGVSQVIDYELNYEIRKAS